MEKNLKKNTYICVTESLCCTPETNTTLYINYTSIKKLKNKLGWELRYKNGRLNA